ncbi:MAG TPA: polysaccharide deacetylase family protein [Ktedonobacterales bacterium]|jgi:peptidoglycan/xylan/chitin deacetylase (PgdA/CDA1 family)
MAARQPPPFYRRFLFLAILVAVLLTLLVISDSRPSSLAQQPARPTATPTPTPTPTPPPPLVYLAAHGNPKLHEIALTFDDGPSAGYTRAILNVLQHYHVLATFFMLGIWVQRYPDLARAVVAAGDAVGDHTWNHLDLTTLSAHQITQQLTNTRNIIQQVTGVHPYVFRPPYEAYNRQVLDIAHSLKLSTILWNIDPHDWARPGVGSIISTVRVNAKNGAIILMHDGGGDRSQTVKALPTIIEQLQKRGFTFVTIPQLLVHLTSGSNAQLAQESLKPNPVKEQLCACGASREAGEGGAEAKAACQRERLLRPAVRRQGRRRYTQ